MDEPALRRLANWIVGYSEGAMQEQAPSTTPEKAGTTRLPTQHITLGDICHVAEWVDWSAATEAGRTVEPTWRPVVRAMALNFDTLTAQAANAGQGWQDWLCHQLIAGLWDQRYRRPVLVFYSMTIPFLVSLGTQSTQATFPEVYSRLHRTVRVQETGTAYLHPKARPVLLWQPPATMVRLWPPTYGPVSPDAALVVDAFLDTYFSAECDQLQAEVIAEDPTGHGEYAIVPASQHATFSEQGKEYPYVNRFCELV